jgi:LPXTG-motif cell wall-anchored protein
MKKISSKIVAIILITVFAVLIIPTKGFASNENIQIVKTNEDYIIYVKDMANKEFKFAVADEKLNSDSIELNFINSVKDSAGNNVALIDETTVQQAKYLYVKEGENSSIIELNFKEAIEKSQIAEVEGTTNRIKTELLMNLEERDEEIDGVKYTEKVGGIKIYDDENANYEYVSVKLPAEKYSTLQELVNKLNDEYEEKDMYSKIEFAKEFSKLYNELIQDATKQQAWKKVENMVIRQPIEAQENDRYVVLIKEEKDGAVKYDAKFMISYRAEEEEKIPGRTETKTVQETAKLPVTGDSLILFGLLAVIVIALIFVFVRMKKNQKKGSH